MRDFFIRGLEVLINVLVVIMALGILAFAGVVSFGGDSPVQGGPFVGLVILSGGFLYLVFVAGFMYLSLGIYQNTRRTAEALEGRMVASSQGQPMGRPDGWEGQGGTARREPPVRRVVD